MLSLKYRINIAKSMVIFNVTCRRVNKNKIILKKKNK